MTARTHEAAHHARHLAALWSVPLAQAGRATLFAADGVPVLCLVPGDRKVSAPRLRDLLSARDLYVLRGDRGVGRAGWRDLPGAPGALPALPGVFGAACLVDDTVMTLPRLVVSLGGGESASISPADYTALVDARVASFSGTTRLPDVLAPLPRIEG